MELALTEDQEFFRDTTRRFLSTECPISVVRESEASDAGFDDGYWRQGAELGWTSLAIPESDGGGSISGKPMVDLSVIADAFGRAVAPGPLIPVNVVASAVARNGTDEQREALLPGILSGEEVGAWCGSDIALGRLPADQDVVARTNGGDILLSGVATPVEAGAQAQHLLVTARTCLLYTSPSPRDRTRSRMPSSA